MNGTRLEYVRGKIIESGKGDWCLGKRSGSRARKT